MYPSDMKNLVATTASISTIIQFLSGTLICSKIAKNKSTGDISSFPFISGCLSTSLWLRYGFYINDPSVILVNTIGTTLFFAYVATFFIYSIKKSLIIKQFLTCLIVLILISIYIKDKEFEQAKYTLGLLCCMVTVLFFAAPLLTVFYIIKIKNTDSLPFPIIFSNFFVSLQWLIYGYIIADNFIKVTNLLGCILTVLQLSLFVLYPKNAKVIASESV